jgi:hypothetical protein
LVLGHQRLKIARRIGLALGASSFETSAYSASFMTGVTRDTLQLGFDQFSPLTRLFLSTLRHEAIVASLVPLEGFSNKVEGSKRSQLRAALQPDFFINLNDGRMGFRDDLGFMQPQANGSNHAA